MTEHLTAAEVKRIAKRGVKVQLEQQWLEAWRRNFSTLPAPVMQYKFHPVRKWRFDFAFIEQRIAVEIDGGSFVGGRHNNPRGQQEDYEKSREAVKLGWRVLRYNTLDMKDPDWVVTDVAEVLTDAKEVV